MKENPAEKETKRDMQAGRLVLDGFLGDDTRNLDEIVAADAEVLNRYKITAEVLAQMMRKYTRAGMQALGDPVQVSGYEIQVDEWMGWLGCPFKDAKRAAKRNTRATKIASGETIYWSDLHLHLIEDHGFFQGKGAIHRLEPAVLLAFFDLDKDND